MKTNKLFALIFFLVTCNVSAIQLSGFVRDKLSGEVLIGANVWCNNQNTGTTTDNRGYFSIKVNTSSIITVSFIGYIPQNIFIHSTNDSLINIKLEPGNSLEEVVVTASRNRGYDVTRLTAKELSLVPAIGGKPDLIKALQLLPGVLTHSEGMSLMMVRGGEPGQNQYLLDNVPLIYVNHLGGLLSVFNPDMINSVDFYKGNFPARHGGKLSSIVDITQREGDLSKHQGSFSLGLTDVAFAFEGPLANKKMSYIVTARKTLIDGLLAGFSALSEGNFSIAAYGFHDVNAKLSWKPNGRNNVSLNLYQGDDYLNYWKKPWKESLDERIHVYQMWGNWLVSGRWNSVISSKLYAENIISYTRYRNKSGLKYSNVAIADQDTEIVSQASVNDFSVRSAWKYAFLRNWNIEFGGHLGFLTYEPNYHFHSESGKPLVGDVYNAVKSALYLDNRIKLFSVFTFQPSLRISNFYNNGDSFLEFEPRVNLSYKINNTQSLNINYMRVVQNSHMVFTQTELLKREVWLPATLLLPPEISNQLSASWYGSFVDGKYSVESNIYYKKMLQLVALKEGYENMMNIIGVDNKIETGGSGLAYGLEILLKKNTGEWTGSISYALSHATRTFANINGGRAYEFDFNRPHSFVLNVNRNFTKNLVMSAVWVLQSGTPYTPALGKQFSIDPETGKTDIELIYGDKNSDRMQPYHRLDLALYRTITTKRGNRAVWTYSVYNVYNHINPFNYYYDNDKDPTNFTYYNRPLKLYKVGLFPLIPSIAYKVYFDYSKKQIASEMSNKRHNKSQNISYSH